MFGLVFENLTWVAPAELMKNILADLAHFFLIRFALLLHQDFVGTLASASFIIQANAHITQLPSNTVATEITV